MCVCLATFNSFHRFCFVCGLGVLSLVNVFFCSAADIERVPERDITNECLKRCFALSLVHIILS